MLISKPPPYTEHTPSRLRRFLAKLTCAPVRQRSRTPPYTKVHSCERACQTELQTTIDNCASIGRAYPSPLSQVIPRSSRVYCDELEKVLNNGALLGVMIDIAQRQEAELQACFADERREFREGRKKTSFCYVLLDPRCMRKLYKARMANLDDTLQLQLFCEGIFYIGKGRKARPHQHLKDAAEAIDQGRALGNAKISRIAEIWASGEGVQSLHVFQDIIPAEAYTREAALIDVIQLENLTNIQSGNYYGVALERWTNEQRRVFGVYLLYTALRQLQLDGYKPLRRIDVCD